MTLIRSDVFDGAATLPLKQEKKEGLQPSDIIGQDFGGFWKAIQKHSSFTPKGANKSLGEMFKVETPYEIEGGVAIAFGDALASVFEGMVRCYADAIKTQKKLSKIREKVIQDIPTESPSDAGAVLEDVTYHDMGKISIGEMAGHIKVTCTVSDCNDELALRKNFLLSLLRSAQKEALHRENSTINTLSPEIFEGSIMSYDLIVATLGGIDAYSAFFIDEYHGYKQMKYQDISQVLRVQKKAITSALLAVVQDALLHTKGSIGVTAMLDCLILQSKDPETGLHEALRCIPRHVTSSTSFHEVITRGVFYEVINSGAISAVLPKW